jgi:hypothetical protein
MDEYKELNNATKKLFSDLKIDKTDRNAVIFIEYQKKALKGLKKLIAKEIIELE